MADPEPLSPAQIVAALEAIADALPAGPEGLDVAARLEWIVERLIERGQLGPGHHRLVRRIKADHAPLRVHLTMVDDKRSLRGPDIDCASLLHLCKARCCSFKVPLSKEDLAEHRLRWNLDEPYVLPRSVAHGYCENLRADGACQVYEDRPAVCRTYDCRTDRRVWSDFEQRIPAELPFTIVPLGAWDEPAS